MNIKTRWKEFDEEWDIDIISKYLPTNYTCLLQKEKERLHREYLNQAIKPNITNKGQMDTHIF